MKKQTASNEEPEFVGFCPECGGEVFAGRNAFWCENSEQGNCHFRLKRRYFTEIGISKPISIKGMSRLLLGGCIPLFGLVSQRTGEPYDCVGFLAFSEKGRWWIRFDFDHFAIGGFRRQMG